MRHFILYSSLLALSIGCWLDVRSVSADVIASAEDGFQVKVVKQTKADSKVAFHSMIHEFSNWWNGDHSFSGDAKNLSMDLEKGCMFEKLPEGGFVRHMEIVFYQPHQTLRLSGGLGPLQGMGVSGSLTFTLTENESGTKIEMTYNVVGSKFQQLDKIAAPVNQVLTEQMERLQKFCDSKLKKEK